MSVMIRLMAQIQQGYMSALMVIARKLRVLGRKLYRRRMALKGKLGEQERILKLAVNFNKDLRYLMRLSLK